MYMYIYICTLYMYTEDGCGHVHCTLYIHIHMYMGCTRTHVYCVYYTDVNIMHMSQNQEYYGSPCAYTCIKLHVGGVLDRLCVFPADGS